MSQSRFTIQEFGTLTVTEQLILNNNIISSDTSGSLFVNGSSISSNIFNNTIGSNYSLLNAPIAAYINNDILTNSGLVVTNLNTNTQGAGGSTGAQITTISNDSGIYLGDDFIQLYNNNIISLNVPIFNLDSNTINFNGGTVFTNGNILLNGNNISSVNNLQTKSIEFIDNSIINVVGYINPQIDYFTQLGNIFTGINATSGSQIGSIITDNVTMGASSTATFNVAHNVISPTSLVFTSITGYTGTFGTNGFPVLGVNCNTGSFDVTIFNSSNDAMNGILTICYRIEI